MMNYQEMSDEEIDLAVSEIVFGKTHGKIVSYAFDEPKFVFTESGHSFTPLENGEVEFTPRIKPTSSWADAGPIAEENEIGVVKVLNGWCATNDHAKHEGVFFVDPNPRRAICIVFLMMKGGE